MGSRRPSNWSWQQQQQQQCLVSDDGKKKGTLVVATHRRRRQLPTQSATACLGHVHGGFLERERGEKMHWFRGPEATHGGRRSRLAEFLFVVAGRHRCCCIQTRPRSVHSGRHECPTAVSTHQVSFLILAFGVRSTSGRYASGSPCLA